MTFIYKILDFIGHNKYWVVLVLGVVIVGFYGDNSVLRFMKYRDEATALEAEIRDFDMKYEKDLKMIKALNTDPHAVARIAREKYFMKTDDEDIFVFSTDLQK